VLLEAARFPPAYRNGAKTSRSMEPTCSSLERCGTGRNWVLDREPLTYARSPKRFYRSITRETSRRKNEPSSQGRKESKIIGNADCMSSLIASFIHASFKMIKKIIINQS